MRRIVEPELMNDIAQAEAYANADFEQADNLIMEAFNLHFPGTELKENILDLGCGPGNISFLFAKRFPDSKIFGIDGSAEMIRLAIARKEAGLGLYDHITFITDIIPGAAIPPVKYSAIVSNSLLHHLHAPEVLWNTIKQYSASDTKILIVDLFRPASKEDALGIVNRYAAEEPEVLQRDFYHSLLAAFTPKEIEQQLVDAGLTQLKLETISDRHLLIAGETKANYYSR